MDSRLKKIVQPSLRDQIVEAIRDAIVQGKFKPGEKIPELDLANQLGVSRTPIREAIRILEQQGLLETRPKSGTFVTPINWDEVQDSLYVRMAMEEFAVREALGRLTIKEWNTLCNNLELIYNGMREAIVRNDPISANKLDIELHTLLIDAARNSYLSRIWRSTGLNFLVWSPERELYPFNDEKWAVFEKRHRDLLDAMHKHDPEQCAEAVRNHISLKMMDLAQWFANEPGPDGGTS
ncbi:MAG TPA: GntR family transcriptional regulator [Anaerolineales bacterium]|nr:GntR family transcriptional regulator [Anaerolineales bacterium]